LAAQRHRLALTYSSDVSLELDVSLGLLCTGVILQKPTGQFRAQIWLDGRNKMIGMFNTAEEAARAYDK
jgi:hypothetical protein